MFTRKSSKPTVNNNTNNTNNTNNNNNNNDKNAFSEEDIEKAEKMFTDSSNTEHQFMLGSLLIKSTREEKIQQAIQIFSTLKDHPSYKRETMYYTAIAHQKLGDLFEAKMYVIRLLKIDSEHKSAKALLEQLDQKIQTLRQERKTMESSGGKQKFNLFKSAMEVEDMSDFKRLKMMKQKNLEDSTDAATKSTSPINLHQNTWFDEEELIKRVPADQMQQLVECFYGLDTYSRKSNTIDREQFCNALGILGLEASSFVHRYLFRGFVNIERKISSGMGASVLTDIKRITIFKDGQEITMNTFLCGMAMLMYGTLEEQAEFAFGILDIDNKGHIVEQDVYNALQTVNEQLTVLGLEVPPLKESSQTIFKLLDPNDTGKVSKTAFRSTLKKNSHIVSSLCLFGDFNLSLPECVARGDPAIFATNDWEYCLGLMIGMRMSQDMYKPMIREPLYEDFGLEVSFRIPNYKPRKGDDEDCNKFIEFAPRVFRKLRDKAGITEAEFMNSLGPEQLIGNLLFGKLTSYRIQGSEGSGGRSGASFLYSHDGKFIVKNISAQEFEHFKKTLPEYYQYLSQNPNSLISRVYGCFIFDGKGFIVMKNVFATHRRIDEIYDLKGSTVARSSPEGPVFKDMDLTQKILVGKEKRSKLLSIMYKDIKFLNDLGFTDYSLLIGIHYTEGYEGKKVQDLKNCSADRSAGNWSTGVPIHLQLDDDDVDNSTGSDSTKSSVFDDSVSKVVSVPLDRRQQLANILGRKATNVISSNNSPSPTTPATPSRTPTKDKALLFDTYSTNGEIDNGVLSLDSKQIFYLGIIDTLTEFSLSKNMELNLKTIKYGLKKRKEISSQPPDEYAQRIRTYVDRIIQ
jgi:Ca2+-binding EF-hand superfamily protein